MKGCRDLKITLAENLKKLRRARDLTQEELAQFLGVTFQAVSKWERNEGYPDITMLPVIANYFEVTVDDLIGNDLISREEKIKQYVEAFWNIKYAADMDQAVEIAEKAYSEYPYEWSIIEIYILALTRRFTQIPDADKLAELRRICEFVMEKCTDPIVRKRAIYAMTFAETDDKVERWFAEAPDNDDFLESERREDRYFDRQQWELYYHQKQQNMMGLVNSLIEKMGYYYDPSPAEWKVESRRRRIAFLEALFPEKEGNLFSARMGASHIELAMALHDAGQHEQAIQELAVGYEYFREHQKIGESLGAKPGEKVHFNDPMWDKLTYPAFPRKGQICPRFFEKLAEEPEYMENETFRSLLEEVRSINA